MPEPTNRLRYPGDVTAGLRLDRPHGVDSTGYPYKICGAHYDPAADTTTVDLEPWPVDDMAGIEAVIAGRRRQHQAVAQIREVFG
jgi:hypothetical protein